MSNDPMRMDEAINWIKAACEGDATTRYAFSIVNEEFQKMREELKWRRAVAHLQTKRELLGNSEELGPDTRFVKQYCRECHGEVLVRTTPRGLCTDCEKAFPEKVCKHHWRPMAVGSGSVCGVCGEEKTGTERAE